MMGGRGEDTVSFKCFAVSELAARITAFAFGFGPDQIENVQIALKANCCPGDRPGHRMYRLYLTPGPYPAPRKLDPIEFMQNPTHRSLWDEHQKRMRKYYGRKVTLEQFFQGKSI